MYQKNEGDIGRTKRWAHMDTVERAREGFGYDVAQLCKEGVTDEFAVLDALVHELPGSTMQDEAIVTLLRTVRATKTRDLVRVMAMRFVLANEVPSAIPLVRLYRLWEHVHFRTHQGMDMMVEELVRIGDSMDAILSVCPEHVLYNPHFPVSLTNLILAPRGRRRHVVLRALFSHGPVQCLVSIAHVAPELHVLMALLEPDLRALLEPYWVSKFSETDAVPLARDDAPECPITLERCVRPVIASDGFTYEQDAIMTLLSRGMTSPMTREPLDIRVHLVTLPSCAP